jgi:pimeloyl-ACP methyl ester carboxylesterase
MTEFLDIAGGRIAYDIAGTGPLVLLAHGLGDMRQAYRFLAPQLAGAGYRVAAMDMRGHGESSTGWDSYTRTGGAGDILALTGHLGGPAAIVGHSFAGGAAVIAATQQPELIECIVLIDPYTRPLKISPLQLAVLKQFLRNPTLYGLYYRLAYPKMKPADFGSYLTTLKGTLRQPGRMAATTAMALADPADAQAALTGVRCPAMIVMGSKDPVFPHPQAEADAIAATLPAGTAVTMIDGGGHYPHAQFPAHVAAAVLPFLADRTQQKLADKRQP